MLRRMSASPNNDGLQILLDRLPPASVLIGLGTAVAAGGVVLFFGGSSFLLRMLGIPILSTGTATLAFGVLKTRSARRLIRLQRAELVASSDADAEQVEALLNDGTGRSVETIAGALSMERDAVVRALGVLQRAGRVDEDLDLEEGTFTYRLEPEVGSADGGDPGAHRSLGERLRELDG